jgi:microcystin-dependent protein
MIQPFLGQIQLFPYNFAPVGWALCQGQILSIAQNTALFALLGTNYGGNGISTFALPNLSAAVARGTGTGAGLTPVVAGETGGEASVTLTFATMPTHTHALAAVTTDAIATTAAGNLLGAVAHASGRSSLKGDIYTASAPATSLTPASVGSAGGGQPHTNLQPYLGLNYCIALQGIFPARG